MEQTRPNGGISKQKTLPSLSTAISSEKTELSSPHAKLPAIPQGSSEDDKSEPLPEPSAVETEVLNAMSNLTGSSVGVANGTANSVAQYFEQKGILRFFERATADMFQTTPDDPLEFLLKRLENEDPKDGLIDNTKTRTEL
eukprot:m.43692 g.43692  ORF g.43692 m.43692 type:complete len:141 (+) comp9996_c0_seq1:239-661(+)